MFLKNGGWMNCGEFHEIVGTLKLDGKLAVQVCRYTAQADANGNRRTRPRYHLRTSSTCEQLPASVRSTKAAMEAARKLLADIAAPRGHQQATKKSGASGL